MTKDVVRLVRDSHEVVDVGVGVGVGEGVGVGVDVGVGVGVVESVVENEGEGRRPVGTRIHVVDARRTWRDISSYHHYHHSEMA